MKEWKILVFAIAAFLFGCVSTETRRDLAETRAEIAKKEKEAGANPTSAQVDEITALKNKLAALETKAAQEKKAGWIYGLDVTGVALQGAGPLLSFFLPGSGVILTILAGVIKMAKESLQGGAVNVA